MLGLSEPAYPVTFPGWLFRRRFGFPCARTGPLSRPFDIVSTGLKGDLFLLSARAQKHFQFRSYHTLGLLLFVCPGTIGIPPGSFLEKVNLADQHIFIYGRCAKLNAPLIGRKQPKFIVCFGTLARLGMCCVARPNINRVSITRSASALRGHIYRRRIPESDRGTVWRFCGRTGRCS